MANVNPKAAAFIERMEAKRLSKECPYLLDMRGKVRGDCRAVEFKGRSFFLDDISYTLFRRGLEKTGGVFTVGLYEAIINGPHTYRGARNAGTANQPIAAAVAIAEGPAIIPFGYNLRRKETRLDIAIPATLTCDDIEFQTTVRNLSPSGLAVVTRVAYRFELRRRVTVDLSALSTEEESEELRRLHYEIVRVKRHRESIDLHLKRIPDESDSAVPSRLAELLELRNGRGRLDVGDDLSTISAFFFERIYADNNWRLPLFLATDGDGGLMPDTLLLTPRNRTLAEQFKHAGRYDLQPLCKEQRLEHLQGAGEFMLMIKRRAPNGILWSCADFEAPEQWSKMLRRAVQEENVLILHVSAADISAPKIERILKRNDFIFADSPVDPPRIPGNLDRLRLLVHLTDITETVGTLYRGYVANEPLEDLGGHLDAPHDTLAPRQIAEILTGVERREERYRARTAVEVTVSGQRHRGHTVDISVKGMQVELDESAVLVERDAEVAISLMGLHQKRPELGLDRLRYQVRNLQLREGKLYLMLARIVEDPRDLHGAFFRELIEQNRAKIEQDDDPSSATAFARFYGNIEAAHLTTLPFFIGAGEEETPVIESVALAATDTGTPACFMGEDGTHDFDALLNPELLRAFSAVSRRRSTPHRFLVRLDSDDEGVLRIEPVDTAKKAQIRAPGGRLMECVVQPVDRYSEIDFDIAVLRIFEKARSKALRLKRSLDKVIAVGELIDITDSLRHDR